MIVLWALKATALILYFYWNKKKNKERFTTKSHRIKAKGGSPPLYINSGVAVFFKGHRYTLPYHPCLPMPQFPLRTPPHPVLPHHSLCPQLKAALNLQEVVKQGQSSRRRGNGDVLSFQDLHTPLP